MSSDLLTKTVGSVIVVMISVLLGLFCKWFFFPYYIPGIPIAKANSFFGFDINRKRNGKFNSHVQMLAVAEEKGKIFQYYWLGYHWVMINDKFLAKHVLDNVTGKGHFHVRFISKALFCTDQRTGGKPKNQQTKHFQLGHWY